MNATVLKGSMETFHYRAATAGGRNVRGTVTARTASDAVTQVSALGLFPIAVERSSSRRQSYVAPGDIALASHLFADLLDAGLPVLRALDCLAQAAPVAFRRRIPVIASRIRAGASVSQSLDAAGGIPPLMVQFARGG